MAYFEVPPPVPAAPPIPAPGAVPVPALPPAPEPAVEPVPGAFGSAVIPIGIFVAGAAEVLVGADWVASGLDESVPFCEFAALAAKAGEAANRTQAAAAAVIEARIMGFPPLLGIKVFAP